MYDLLITYPAYPKHTPPPFLLAGTVRVHDKAYRIRGPFRQNVGDVIQNEIVACCWNHTNGRCVEEQHHPMVVGRTPQLTYLPDHESILWIEASQCSHPQKFSPRIRSGFPSWMSRRNPMHACDTPPRQLIVQRLQIKDVSYLKILWYDIIRWRVNLSCKTSNWIFALWSGQPPRKQKKGTGAT